MVDIFISYSREDRNKAKMIANALEKNDLNTWMDDKIEPGKPFDDIILKTLEKAKCIIVLWSNASIKSKWVKEEAIVGLERENLIPVLIEEVDLPIGFKRIQAVDLIDWEGSTEVPRFSILLNAILEILRDEPGSISFKKKMSNSEEKLASGTENSDGYGCGGCLITFAVCYVSLGGVVLAILVSENRGLPGLAWASIIIVITILIDVFILWSTFSRKRNSDM